MTALVGATPSTDVSNIGRPFGRNVIYVLDDRLRHVPLGCIGELFISGPQVAHGYLGDPEQTAKYFVNDPFRAGYTMYASGDLVRMSPIDYSLTYLGRRDTQIKIRGLRVEIGEIETVLKTASLDVINAAVLKVDAGHESLVAFLELSSDTAPKEMAIVQGDANYLSALIATLVKTVSQKLPSYMVPALYVPLNRFPLTSSGKLDRKYLGTFFYSHQQEIRDLRYGSELFPRLVPFEGPQDELQAMLRSIWASTLNLNEDSLSINDNFFAAGGDSISAIRLASLARDAGIYLQPTDIIQHPTIRSMAQIVQSAVPDHDYDDDETPSSTLDRISPEDLTLLDVDQHRLDMLRNELLPAHGLSPT